MAAKFKKLMNPHDLLASVPPCDVLCFLRNSIQRIKFAKTELGTDE